MPRQAFIDAAKSLGASLIYAPDGGDAAANRVPDLSASGGHNGELKNGAALVTPGLIADGAAASLDGVNDYIDTGHEPFVSGTTQTFVGFANRTDTSSNDVLFAGSGATPPFCWLASGNQNVVFQAKNGAGGAATFTGAWPGNAQTVFYCIVFDDPNNLVTLYLNGKLVESKEHANTYSGQGHLQVGAFGAAGSENFKGSLLPFAVFTKALSAGELLSLAQAGGFASFSLPPPPSQITLTAIAEGGNGRGYDLTDEAEGLQWSSVNPGGDEVCTFTIDRSWWAENPEIAKGNLIRVICGIDVLWQGRVEEIDRASGDSESLAVTAYGLGNRLGDSTFREIYVDRDLGKWGEPSTQRQINMFTLGRRYEGGIGTSFQDKGAAYSGIVFTFQRFTAQIEIAEAWYSLGIDLGEIRVAEVRRLVGGADASFSSFLYLSSDDIATSVDSSPDYDYGNTTNASVTASASGRQYAQMEWIYGGEFTGDGQNTLGFLRPRVFGRHGLTPKGEVPSEGFSADQIVGHIVGQASDTTARRIDSFAYVIPQFVVETPTTPKDALPQVNAFANADYGTWGPDSALDSSTNGYFDFTAKDPTTQHWFATRTDFEGDLAFHTETASLYDAVDVNWSDEAGASHTERFSIDSPDLKAAGLSPRVYSLDAGTTTKAGAQILAEIFLDIFAGFAPARGSGSLNATVRHYRRGELPAHYMRADGSNIRVPDILPAETAFALDSTPDRRTTFPIKRVSVDCSGDYPRTSVEFDQATDELSKLLAQTAAQAALVG